MQAPAPDVGCAGLPPLFLGFRRPRSRARSSSHAAKPQERRSLRQRRSGYIVTSAAILCVACSGEAFAGLRLPGPSIASRKVAVRAEAERSIDVDVKGERNVVLEGATVGSMDSLMKEEAVKVLAAGAERTEIADKKRGTWYAYMPSLQIGPVLSQTRLVCEVRMERTGAVQVEVVGFEFGQKEQGSMVFKSYPAIKMNWLNRVSWQAVAGQEDLLSLQHLSCGKVKMPLPRWWPLPDAVLSGAARAGISLMIKDGQSKVIKAIKSRHSARQSVSVQ